MTGGSQHNNEEYSRSAPAKGNWRRLVLRKSILGFSRFLVVSLVLFFVTATVAFLLFSALPADPVRSALGVNASEEAVDAVRREFGYDQPLPSRFAGFLSGLLRADLGRSLVTRRPVAPDVTSAMVATLRYVGLALCLSTTGSLTMLAIAYFGGTPIRRCVLATARLLTSLPSIVVALSCGLLFIVSNAFWFIGDLGVRQTVAAAIALSVYPTCSLTEIGVTETGDIRERLFVTASRSFGFSEIRLFFGCVLRSSLLPWLAQLSNIAASLVAGSVVLEMVFSLQGLGATIARCVQQNDFPTIQGVVFVSVFGFIVVHHLFEFIILSWQGGRTTERTADAMG